MELRSRKSLNSNTQATSDTPAPSRTLIATSQKQTRASLDRFATEPPVGNNHEDQQNISIEVGKEIPAPRASVLRAVRSNFPVVPGLRARSTPAILQPQDQAFDILEKKIGDRLSAEDFATYRALISDRVILVVDDSARRVRNSGKLQSFLESHTEVLEIHNTFARRYNRTKKDIFHLPGFQPRSVKQHGTSTPTHTAPTGVQAKATKIRRPSIAKPIVEHAMEMSKANVEPVNHVTPRDSGGNDSEHAVPEILRLRATTPSQKDVSMDRPEDEQALSEQDEASSRTRVVRPSSGDQAAQQREQEGEKLAAPEPIVVLTSSQHTQALRISADERAARPERAQSYLAWLHHRQARFPTARPNSSECVLVARKLGRPSVSVHEDVLHHWSLETDSQRGEWYRQNRVQTLGEDPRFDAESMSTWEAWLKQGRDVMERKCLAMEVDESRKE